MNDGFDEESIKNQVGLLLAFYADYSRVTPIFHDSETDGHEIEITTDGKVYRLAIIGERFED